MELSFTRFLVLFSFAHVTLLWAGYDHSQKLLSLLDSKQDFV